MGVRVRLSRNTSMYVPFWIAVPVWLIWACGFILYAVIMVLYKVTAYGITSATAAIERRRAGKS